MDPAAATSKEKDEYIPKFMQLTEAQGDTSEASQRKLNQFNSIKWLRT